MSEIPNSWLRTRLGEITDYGKVDRIESRDIPDDAWVLALADIEKDTSRLLERVTFAQRQSKSTKNRFRKGEVLYGKLRPYLNKVLMADDDGFCTTEIVPISSSNAIIGRYLFYWLRTPEFLAYVNAVSYGLNMPRLGTKDGLAAPAILAPITEQKRIADKLDSLLQKVDTCQEHLERVPQIIKRFRQSVLAEAVSGRLTEEWREEKNFGERSLGDYEFPELPLNWTLSPIAEVGIVKGGKRLPKGEKLVEYDTGFPYIKAGQLKEGTVIPEDQQYLLSSTQEKISRYIVDEGDVYITIVGAKIGDAGVIPKSYDKANLTENAAKICQLSGLQGDYLALWLRSPHAQEIINNLIKSGAQGKLALFRIKTIPVPLPPIDEQTEIVEQVKRLFAFADRLEARWQAGQDLVEKLTPSLLAKAFRGELVEQDPEDEPASVLLERIRAARAAG